MWKHKFPNHSPSLCHLQNNIQDNKKFGVGCIPVNQQQESEIDHPIKVKNRIDIIKKRIGQQNIRYIHPDCGLRNTPIRIVEQILSNMKEASEMN